MSFGPVGIISSIAGVPRVQARGTEVEREGIETAAATSEAESERQADDAAGVGTTSEESETNERDADGRRLWERSIGRPAAAGATESESPAGVRDPRGEAGSQLDLSG